MKNSAHVSSYVRLSDTLNPCICPACGVRFGSEAATNSHLSQSRQCAWYRKGKIPDLTYLDNEDYEEDLPNSDQDKQLPVLDDIPDFNESSDDEAVPIATSSSSLPPSPKRARIEVEENDNNSKLVEDIHPTAGKIISNNTTIQQKWHEALRSPTSPNINIFNPFESEVDWRMVEWLVNDGPSQSGNDRLLKITNVCSPIKFTLSIKLTYN
jgi:hypothetical protein